MDILKFDLSLEGKPFKVLNATNGGPWSKRHASDMVRSNFDTYKAARIPYSRNHDCAINSVYGGPYSHDVSCIFPNFDADPYDPASYDFACTDESILICTDAGTETFFRLGQTIEHQIKKHHIFPPKDFHKWAVICEHIIRHYNEGWADGYQLGITYWEIWNEPDNDPEDSAYRRCWGGTYAQFYDFYETAAKHLKSCFPHLKIGGPAVALRAGWLETFLTEMKKRNVEMDFVSWHLYTVDPRYVLSTAAGVKAVMDKCGYGNAESILNEWNYVKNWEDKFKYTISCIHGIKGAIFALSCMCDAQNCDAIDMMMYYDTRPSSFNGVFDFYTYEPLKGYYPFYWYGMFYDMVREIPSENRIEDIHSLCGVGEDGKLLAVVAHYSDYDYYPSKTVSVDFGREGVYEVYLLDEEHDATLIGTTGDLTFEMKLQSALLIKEV